MDEIKIELNWIIIIQIVRMYMSVCNIVSVYILGKYILNEAIFIMENKYEVKWVYEKAFVQL